MWDINLPHEVQNLKKHIEMRQELAEKMKSFPLDWKKKHPASAILFSRLLS